MSRPTRYGVAAQVARGVDFTSESDATEGELLARFIQTKDESAFAELVRRLGPMVLGVCCRIAGDSHLAEDAFQAAFIVLARRASHVRPRDGVRGWLYGVAARTAKRARAVSIHQRNHEVDVPSAPERPAEVVDLPEADAIRILEEEVSELPDHLRATVVLCELEGQSRKEAAGKLGIPEGTLSSRLAAARKRLAARLRQRGVALSTAALTTTLARLESAQPPAALLARAARAAAGEQIPPSVAVLSQGVLRMMFLNKLKTAVPLALLVAGLLACATSAAVPPATPPDPPRAPVTPPLALGAGNTDPPPAKAEPKPLPQGPNKLLFFKDRELAMVDPDGKNETTVAEKGAYHPVTMRLSPDGKQVAALRGQRPKADAGAQPGRVTNPKNTLAIKDVAKNGPWTELGIVCERVAWAPDGTRIATTDWTVGADKKRSMVHHLVDVNTKEKKPLKLPDTHTIMDWMPDGKYLLTTSTVTKDDKRVARLHLMTLDGAEHKALTDEKMNVSNGRISPDGTRVLCAGAIPPEMMKPEVRFFVLDIATGKTTPVADVPLNAQVSAMCWSADGKQIAYVWRQVQDAKKLRKADTESHLIVCDPDGKNQKTIVTVSAKSESLIVMGGVDWR